MNNTNKRYIALFIFCLNYILLNFYVYGLGAVKQVNNVSEFNQYVLDTIYSLNKNFEVQINNYDEKVYSIQNALSMLENDSPEIAFLFDEAINGKIVGYSNSTQKTITYQFSYKNDPLTLKNICIIRTPEELKNAFTESFANYEKGMYVKIFDYSKEKYDFGEILELVLTSNPGFGTGYKSLNSIKFGSGENVIIEYQYKFEYDYETILKMRKEADNKASELVAQLIDKEMPDYQKELIIHDYIVNNTDYDQENYIKDTVTSISRSVYGVLFNKKAVCEGYALTMKKLLDLAGVECIVVFGEAQGTPHAWNIVKIQGEYYQVDATWDDPYSDSGEKILRYDYFNVTDSTLKEDHKWEESKYPRCSSIKYNYESLIKAKNDNLASNSDTILSDKKLDSNIKTTYLKFTIGSKYFEKNKVTREIDYGRDVSPVIKENRTLVPVRVIVESLSGILGWDEKTATVTIEKDGKKIYLKIGDKNARVDDKNIILDYPAVILNGRTFIPLRFVSESLGCLVNWISQTKEVEISL